jgi:hypothetical protein
MMHEREPDMRRILAFVLCLAFAAPAIAQETRQENYESWPPLTSTFPSTGGGGFVIKGYDPVIVGEKCVTTFMAVAPGGKEVFANYAEFESVSAAGGTLCRNGKWRAFDGGNSGTTPFRFFFKDGVFRAAP